MDNETITIFINSEASKVEDLFLNESWKLKEIYDRIYSIKVNDKKINWLVKTYEKKRFALKETENLNKLKKVKGVPKVLGAGISEKLNYIIISEAPGLDLYEYTQKHGEFTEKTVKPIAIQLLKILVSLQSKKVVHKDIKPENIIYDEKSGNVTLIDFEEKYTDDYRSPEQVFDDDKLTSKTDIWSTGLTIYYLLKRDLPFKTEEDILNKPIRFSSKWSEELKDFLSCLIERESDLRYSAKEALSHIWITN